MSEPAWRVLCRSADGAVHVVDLARDGVELGRHDPADLAAFVRASGPEARWVWSDAARWYPELLTRGVTIARCHDLRLCHAILSGSTLVADRAPLRAATAWDAATSPATRDDALFGFDDEADALDDPDEVLAEFARQRAAVAASSDPARLRLLLAAESAGALVAAELHAAGLPWDVATHDAVLTQLLGPRPASGAHPVRVEGLAARVRAALNDPTASLDSQPKLLRALHRVGVLAQSTSRWELAEYEHPVVAPLLEYKKLMRLLTANGWTWLDEWVTGGRFRPVYVPAGVVTGRWASSGGGALQIPRQLRSAVRADPGWVLVSADVAQLEPRVLAGMSRDLAFAGAARGADLYAGLVARGVVSSRDEAKVAVLGAMYGATTGDSGRLVPSLRRAFPRAMALVDDAARVGEDGGLVSTWLGRTSPAPSPEWHAVQARASDADAGDGDRERARRSARDRGRFTRNFVVQGTAAEWALAWLAELRLRLATLPHVSPDAAAPASGPAFARRAHLVFFLHDEVIVHAPAAHADAAATAVREAAELAGRLLFGDFPIDFPLDLRVDSDAAKA